jgi:hypothetical protein
MEDNVSLRVPDIRRVWGDDTDVNARHELSDKNLVVDQAAYTLTHWGSLHHIATLVYLAMDESVYFLDRQRTEPQASTMSSWPYQTVRPQPCT